MAKSKKKTQQKDNQFQITFHMFNQFVNFKYLTHVHIISLSIELLAGSKTTQYNRYGPRKPTLTPSTTTTPTVITTPPGGRDVRLPLNLYPVLYELELQPFIYETNPTDFYFSGTVTIEMECRQSTNEIVLHSNQLNITKSSVRIEPIAPGQNPIIPTIEFDTVNHFLVLKTNTQLVGGSNYSVYIEFRGPLLSRPPGFYQSSYQLGNDTM